MSAGPVADRVYARLRERLLRHHYRPGERLELIELCAELASSNTPVRDALNRLLGEGLVETPGRDGFNVPAFDEPALADLYRWSGELMRLALARGARTGRPQVRLDPGDLPYPARVATLFEAIAERSDNCEHARAVEQVCARLSPVRWIEPGLFPDVDAEFEVLRGHFCSGSDARLRQALHRFHARRIQRASALVRLLYRAGP